MSKTVANMDYVKKVIRSLLVTNQDGLTLKHLDNLYYEFEGHRIPYRQHEFSGLIDLMTSIKDVAHPVRFFSFFRNSCVESPP